MKQQSQKAKPAQMKTVQLFLPASTTSVKQSKDLSSRSNQKTAQSVTKRPSDKFSTLSKADTSVDEIAPSSQFASIIEPSKDEGRDTSFVYKVRDRIDNQVQDIDRVRVEIIQSPVKKQTIQEEVLKQKIQFLE